MIRQMRSEKTNEILVTLCTCACFNDVKVFVILQKLFLQISSQVHCKCLAKVARFSTVCMSRKQLTDS